MCTSGGATALRLGRSATAQGVGVLRREVSRWLVTALDDEETVEALTLAVSEAVENAVDHAFPDGAPVRVAVCCCRDAAGTVTLRVTDDGRWKVPGDPGRRGRGLALIGACCTSARVTSGRDGTAAVLVHVPR